MAAGAGFLGNLGDQLNTQTQKLACFELAKKLSHLDAREIRKHLPERLPSF